MFTDLNVQRLPNAAALDEIAANASVHNQAITVA